MPGSRSILRGGSLNGFGSGSAAAGLAGAAVVDVEGAAVADQARETDRKLLIWSGIFTGGWMLFSLLLTWLKGKLLP